MNSLHFGHKFNHNLNLALLSFMMNIKNEQTYIKFMPAWRLFPGAVLQRAVETSLAELVVRGGTEFQEAAQGCRKTGRGGEASHT